MVILRSAKKANPQEISESLDCAIKELEKHYINDARFPSLEEQLKIQGSPTFSGINDFDYQPSIPVYGDSIVAVEKQVTSTKRVPLPDELLEQFSHMQCNCVMGLFPEISRAWLAIDSDIYFWVYEDGSDVAYYDGIKEVILASGLIAPKPGVFQEHINYILCITTPVNIYLLGINLTENRQSVGGETYGVLQLHPEPLFVVSTDNVYMTSICGTANGRIFLAGKDNCLYELVYQMAKAWFGKKCYKINHSSSRMSFLVPNFVTSALYKEDPISQLAVDNSRSILYYRTENGNIKVCYLGEKMDQFRGVVCVNSSTIASEANYITRTVDGKNFERIVHIAPIPKSDSNCLHLVAITHTGVRLYFTTNSLNNPYGEPYSLKLLHVRMPPGFAPSLSPEKPVNIHAAYYRRGTCLVIGGMSNDQDRFWCFSSEIFPFKPTLKESQAVFNIDGHTWSLGEIADFSEYSSNPCHLYKDRAQDPPAIVTQHVNPPRRFIMLSAQGSHIITTLRPREQLESILLATSGIDYDAVASYFQQYGATQACATCLVIICQSRESERELIDLATEAFFRYGDERATNENQHQQQQPPGMGSFTVGSPVQGGSSQGSFLGTPISNTGYHNQTTMNTPAPPNLSSTMVPGHQPLDVPHLFSGKHNGLYLYFSRIMRPIWSYPLVYEAIGPDGNSQIWSRISALDLSWFIDRLVSLKRFLVQYSDITLSQSPTYKSYQAFALKSGAASQELYQSEQASVKSYQQLVTLSIEGLQLWRLVCEHQFHVVIHSAPVEVQEKIRHTAFKDLFSPAGHDLSNQLVNCVMASCMSDATAVETASEFLRGACPTLFSADDAVCTKANKIVQGSVTIQSGMERNKKLFEAIKLYAEVPDLVDLQWVCEQFNTNYFYDGLVDLCLTIAVKRDPSGIALHFFKNGEPRDDKEGAEMHAYRKEAYNCILKTLEVLSTHIENPATTSIPSKPGPPDTTNINFLTADSAQKHYDSIITRALGSGDELFHVAHFDWLIQREQTNTLLMIKSPFLEQYLIGLAAQQHPNNRKTLDLIWMFYERNGKFLAAAKVLMKLAEMEGPSLTVHSRLEYLSRAAVTAKGSSSAEGAKEGEFVEEIEEKLEVARIQLQIFEELSKKSKNRAIDDAMVKLNTNLYDVSVLYGDFAEAFALPECKLSIISCANHNDAGLVRSIWKDIIEKAFTDSRHLAVPDRTRVVSMEMIKYGRYYFNNEMFFPIDFLITHLECRSCEMDLEANWVFNMFLEIGVQFPSLVRTYSNLISRKENVWKAMGKPLHLWNVFSQLTLVLLENDKYNDAKFTLCRELYEYTTSYLVDLESMDGTQGHVKILLSRFKNIQARLKRML